MVVLCVLVAVALIADAAFLMSRHVFSLGVTLPLAIGCALLLLASRWTAVQRWIRAKPWRHRAWRWGWFACWLWVASVAAFWAELAQGMSEQAGVAAPPPAAVVVLGSGTPGGAVTPMLAARLDTAYQRAQAAPGALLVVSGGVDRGETRSEGEVMGDYLRAKGLAPQRIAQEQRSTSTEQNLLYSRRILGKHGIAVQRARIEIVTSDFHTLRARWIARRAGYADVHAVGAPTPLYLRYNAWLREYFAAISGWMLGEY